MRARGESENGKYREGGYLLQVETETETQVVSADGGAGAEAVTTMIVEAELLRWEEVDYRHSAQVGGRRTARTWLDVQ